MSPMDGLAIPDECGAAVGQLGQEFLASIYGVAASRHPENLDVLAELGHVYTRLGRYEEGLEVDMRLVAQAPEDPLHRYNLACSLALLGRTDPALDALEHAVDLGYDDIKFLASDEDLSSLREHPRFMALVGPA